MRTLGACALQIGGSRVREGRSTSRWTLPLGRAQFARHELGSKRPCAIPLAAETAATMLLSAIPPILPARAFTSVMFCVMPVYALLATQPHSAVTRAVVTKPHLYIVLGCLYIWTLLGSGVDWCLLWSFKEVGRLMLIFRHMHIHFPFIHPQLHWPHCTLNTILFFGGGGNFCRISCSHPLACLEHFLRTKLSPQSFGFTCLRSTSSKPIWSSSTAYKQSPHRWQHHLVLLLQLQRFLSCTQSFCASSSDRWDISLTN